MRSNFTKLFTLIFLVTLGLNGFSQGTTTSAISGSVQDENGEGLAGAIVKAIHTPSGSVFGAVTQEDGNYIIPNARVGGPYRIEASYIGYEDRIFENVTLNLGQRFRQDVKFDTSGNALDAVVVTATTGYPGQNNGVSNQISTEQIESLPTLDRDLSDFTRTTPQASTKSGGISFAGLNNRYNAVYIDGAVNNDVFGLSSDGTNGGQIGISPISVDAIEQIQVVVSPYDVKQGGFAGGGINAVTRSGTNNFEGSAYYFVQNESLAGKTNAERADFFGQERTKLDDFTEKVYGLRLGGPIVKDKAFFFLNAEFQNNETPDTFDLGGYRGNAGEAEINQLSTFLMNNYNYDPGSFTEKTSTLDGNKVLGKFDFNLNNRNKLTARHSYTQGESFSPGSSSSSTIRSGGAGVLFPSVTNSSAIEWNFNSSNTSNNLTLGYTNVRDNRDPIGSPFPYASITDGSGRIEIGSEQFSTANNLEQDIFTLTNNFEIYKGNHTFTIGTHNEFGKFLNIFIPQAFGSYEFSSLQAFYDGTASRYRRSYSIVDGDAFGDASVNAAAKFNTTQLGLYAQDEWFATDNLTLTAGIRFDLPFFNDDPGIFNDFATETLPRIQNAGWDVSNIDAGEAPAAQLMVSPRVGFNWQPEQADRLTLKGGAGIFTSRIPFVWPGAMFSTNGLKQGAVDQRNVDFRSDVDNQYTVSDFGGTDQVPAGDINIFEDDFRYPQVFRTSLGVEKEFGEGWNVVVDGIYTKTMNNVEYKSVNFFNEYTSTPAPESRIIYTGQRVDNRYRDIYVGYNTSEGYTFNISGGISKSFDNNLTSSFFYSYGDAFATNEATSSQNSSQWRGQVHDYQGRNNPVFGRSDFSAGHRFVTTAAYKFDWNEDKNVSTTLSLFYNGQTGSPFSWTVGGRSGSNISNELGSNSRNRTLFFIPQNEFDIALVGNSDLSASEQWQLLDRFIENDDYLRENRGKYAEKNSNRLPFESLLDVKIIQDFAVNVGNSRQRFQFTADIFNFGNLINKDWGTTFGTNDEFTYQQIVNFEGLNSNNRPTYSFEEEALKDDRFTPNDISSRWRAQLGFRYLFD